MKSSATQKWLPLLMFLAFTTMLCIPVLRLMVGHAARKDRNAFLDVEAVGSGSQPSEGYDTLLEDYGSDGDEPMEGTDVPLSV